MLISQIRVGRDGVDPKEGPGLGKAADAHERDVGAVLSRDAKLPRRALNEMTLGIKSIPQLSWCRLYGFQNKIQHNVWKLHS